MDGVLADFDKRVADLMRGKDEKKMTSDAFWDIIKREDHFFLNLDTTPYAKRLVSLAKMMCDDVQILTALPRNAVVPHAEQDKRDWVKKHFPDANLKFNIGPYSQDKWKHAKPGDVLIDDLKSNIIDWRNKGHGNGIIHSHYDYQSTVNKLILITA